MYFNQCVIKSPPFDELSLITIVQFTDLVHIFLGHHQIFSAYVLFFLGDQSFHSPSKEVKYQILS